MPAAPASSTSRALPDVDPSDPDHGERRRGGDVSEPVQPDGNRFRLGVGGPHRDTEIVRARHLGDPHVLRVAHAHAEDALGSEASSSGGGSSSWPTCAPEAPELTATSIAIVHEQWDPRLGAGLDQRRRERHELVVAELRPPKLDRRRTALHGSGCDRPMGAAADRRSGGDHVEPERPRIQSGHRSLRRHCPVQVLRVAGRSRLSARPRPSSPVRLRRYPTYLPTDA